MGLGSPGELIRSLLWRLQDTVGRLEQATAEETHPPSQSIAEAKRLARQVSTVIEEHPEIVDDRGYWALNAHWPEKLEIGKFYRFLCDDKGANGSTYFQLLVAEDGDVHVSMQEWEDPRVPESRPDPFPSVRCRTFAGGGRCPRTRQALLWLAEAIRRDNEEFGTPTDG